MYLLRILTIFLFVFAMPIQALVDASLQCHKVVIAGDSQWPPYTIVVSSTTGDDNKTSQVLGGVGIDLAKRIFAELDVPVVEFAYHDSAHMMQGLRDGEIDLIVSAYDYSGIDKDVQLIEPAYMIDPVTVAVPRNMRAKITNWDSLSGLNGVTELTFIPDDKTGDFINSYLHISHRDFLLAALQSVKNGIYKYILGSDLQLSYAIRNNQLSQDLIVMKNLIKGGEVHMAFSNNSACKQYATYVQKRLQDYKNNGTVEKVLKKYIY